MSSGSGGTSSGLVTQGSVDWVSLSQKSVHFSVEVLSRFSRAGVEMITVAIGQAIFSGFNVPADGQQRLADAIAKLKGFPSYGDILWFGFGIKHIVRTLCETEQGATCTAICACLSVSYDTLFAGQVLKDLADESKVPGSLTPSLPQWAALVDVCSGAVTDSKFPTLVEGFSRLIAGTQPGFARRPFHKPTTAKALAGALRELSKLSRGDLRSVTFQGGVDCGWLAAVAEWLLSLKIEIIDSAGNRLYSSSSNNGLYAQVTIIPCYVVAAEPGAKLLSRSYFVPPGQLCFSMDHQTRMEGVHLFSGRSEWDNILRTTFGGAADELLRPENAVNLATLFCCELQDSENPYPVPLLSPWEESYLDGRYEQRQKFLNFAAHKLPELNIVFKAAENNPEKTYGYFDSLHYLTSQHNKLRDICPCSSCSKGRNSIPENERWCLCLVGLTIFQFVWTLSWLDIHPSIKPCPNGLLKLYGNPIFGALGRHKTITGLFDFGLKDILSFFTGVEGAGNRRGSSALAQGGICVYSACLKDPTVGPRTLLRYHLVPGHIERDRFIYDTVSDPPGLAISGPGTNTLKNIISKLGPSTQLQLVVEETLNSKLLMASFIIGTQPFGLKIPKLFSHNHDHIQGFYGQQNSLSGTHLGVYEIRWNVGRATTLVHCSARNIEIVNKSIAAWTGICSAGESMLRIGAQDAAECLPRQAEWFLRSSDFDINIVRGNYPLLYALLCLYCAQVGKTIWLTYAKPCFICTTLNSPGDAVPNSLHPTPPRLIIYSMTGANPTVLELASSMQWKSDDVLAFGGEALDQQLRRRSYLSEGKQVLAGVLRHRGIPFEKNTTKEGMIRILEEHAAVLNSKWREEEGMRKEEEMYNLLGGGEKMFNWTGGGEYDDMRKLATGEENGFVYQSRRRSV